MADSANNFSYLITDQEVRITFSDIRPDVRPDDRGHHHTPPPLITDVMAEVVVSRAVFDKMLKVGHDVLSDHEAKKSPN